MKVNANSWYIWIARSTFGWSDFELPKSLCSLFWYIIASFIFLPISAFGHLVNFILCRNRKTGDFYPLNAFFVGTLFYVSSALTWQISQEKIPWLNIGSGNGFSSFSDMLIDFLDLQYYGLIGVLFLVIFGGLLFLIVKALAIYTEHYKEKKKRDPAHQIIKSRGKKPLLLFEYIKAKKNKFCPRVEYFYSKNN